MLDAESSDTYGFIGPERWPSGWRRRFAKPKNSVPTSPLPSRLCWFHYGLQRSPGCAVPPNPGLV